MKFAVVPLLLSLSLVCSATSIDFTDETGLLVGSTAGLTLTECNVTGIEVGLKPPFLGPNLGTINFTTAGLVSGNLQMGGMFAAGGTFTISTNGSDGLFNGVIFTGTFAGPVFWQEIPLANGTHSYVLSGAVSGTWFNGKSVDGVTIQLTLNTKGFFDESLQVGSGNTLISGNGIRVTATPEPGTISMMGTGLLMLGGMLRRSFR